jgi:hypothetical protein
MTKKSVYPICSFYAVLAIFAAGETLFAFCCEPRPRLVRAEYSQSDAVVIAHLVKSRHIKPKDDQDYYHYTFEVDTTLRGAIPRSFDLRNYNDSSRLAFDILPDCKYLLFLESQLDENLWKADSCGRSGEVSKRTKTLQEIERVRSLQSALITGVVYLPEEKSVATMVAIRKKDGKRYESRVSGCAFSIEVPPGEYSVSVNMAARSFVMHWLSYEDPDFVKLEKGGCAQIAFVPSDSDHAVRPAKIGRINGVSQYPFLINAAPQLLIRLRM